MRMQEFKDGKIAVWAETVEESGRFLDACAKEGLKWHSGKSATDLSNICVEQEYSVGALSPKTLSFSRYMGGAKKQYGCSSKPYEVITVNEFFKEGKPKMMLKEFMDGKISVKAETKEDAERFLNALAKEGVRWNDGDIANANNPHRARTDYAYAIGYSKPGKLGCAIGEPSYYQKNGTPAKPYKLVTVRDFFGERDFTFDAFKRCEYAVTFKSPKRGDKDVEQFLKVCKEKGFNTYLAESNGNIEVGIRSSRNMPLELMGNHSNSMPKIPFEQVKWAQAEKSGSVIARLLRGEVNVHIRTKEDAKKALKEIHAAGGAGSGAVESCDYHVPCWLFVPDFDTHCVYFEDNHCSIERHKSGAVTVEYSDATKPANEQIVIYRDKDGSVKCVQKQDGKVVASSSVTRYFTDKDDLRAAAKFALEKLGGEKTKKPEERKPVEYKVGNRVMVRNDLVEGKRYGNDSAVDEMLRFKGKIVTLSRQFFGKFSIEEDAGKWNWTPEMFSGLATKTPPFDKDGNPNYKVGQKVRMKRGFRCGEPFVGEIEQVTRMCRSDNMVYEIWEPNGESWWQQNKNVIGLADEEKTWTLK